MWLFSLTNPELILWDIVLLTGTISHKCELNEKLYKINLEFPTLFGNYI